MSSSIKRSKQTRGLIYPRADSFNSFLWLASYIISIFLIKRYRKRSKIINKVNQVPKLKFISTRIFFAVQHANSHGSRYQYQALTHSFSPMAYTNKCYMYITHTRQNHVVNLQSVLEMPTMK